MIHKISTGRLLRKATVLLLMKPTSDGLNLTIKHAWRNAENRTVRRSATKTASTHLMGSSVFMICFTQNHFQNLGFRMQIET